MPLITLCYFINLMSYLITFRLHNAFLWRITLTHKRLFLQLPKPWKYPCILHIEAHSAVRFSIAVSFHLRHKKCCFMLFLRRLYCGQPQNGSSCWHRGVYGANAPILQRQNRHYERLGVLVAGGLPHVPRSPQSGAGAPREDCS